MNDVVNSPKHYTSNPSGIECIDVVEHLGFCVGNAIKYLWRVGLKGDPIEDLEKARWYIDREIARRKKLKPALEAAWDKANAPLPDLTYATGIGWTIEAVDNRPSWLKTEIDRGNAAIDSETGLQGGLVPISSAPL